jgi:lipopolysaccharide export system permease protein
VIKKLDILIIKSFTGPFLATFLLSTFVMVLQFFWLYLDDMVGKNIDFFTIMYIIGVYAISSLPMALPLSLLLSSIMTFVNLGETFEIVAIKSAGIPLLRFMRPLVIITIFLCFVAFFTANNVIPVAQLKLAAVKYDMIISKPAFDISEGVFYDKFPGYEIQIGKKDKDDSTIHNVIIYNKNYNLQDNLLVAQSGIMRITPDKKFLVFTLYNGWNYEEKGSRYNPQTEFYRTGFKEYKKIFDLSSFQFNKSEDSSFKYDPKMLSIRQLNMTIDSLENKNKYYLTRAKREIEPNFHFLPYLDSVSPKINTDSLKNIYHYTALVPDSQKFNVYSQAVSQTGITKSNIQYILNDYEAQQKSIREHKIEWQRKFTFSFACLVLFLIGAPLGSIIRKGGLGTPLVFAVIFFTFFYLFNTLGEKFARENVMSTWAGMWLASFILLPVGFFLTYKAMKDSQLFNQEFYYRTFKGVKKMLKRKVSSNSEDI